VLRNVAVPVIAPVPTFELGVACEAFGLDRSPAGLPSYDFAVCAEHTGPIPTTSGFAVTASHGLERLAAADLILVLGAAPPTPAPPAALIRQLRQAVQRGATVASMCTGAFVLAAARLLDGRRAATHWMHAPLLARLYPQVMVEADRLYVEDGPVLTSAGSAAAIDLCLHLIRRAHGAETANSVARQMVVPAHRDGGQSQYVEMPLPEPEHAGDLGETLEWAQQHLDQPITVDLLAARAAMSPRTFARRFRQQTGTTPGWWLSRHRLMLAERLLERGNQTIASIAARSGFGSADTLRRHFARARGTTPEQYRRAFRLTAQQASTHDTPPHARPKPGHATADYRSPTKP
jgi:transcriptional regulator GlxA family with amidase domain